MRLYVARMFRIRFDKSIVPTVIIPEGSPSGFDTDAIYTKSGAGLQPSQASTGGVPGERKEFQTGVRASPRLCAPVRALDSLLSPKCLPLRTPLVLR